MEGRQGFQEGQKHRVGGMWPCLQRPVALLIFGGNDGQAVGHHNEAVIEGIGQDIGQVGRGLEQLVRGTWSVAVQGCPTLAFPQPL